MSSVLVILALVVTIGFIVKLLLNESRNISLQEAQTKNMSTTDNTAVDFSTTQTKRTSPKLKKAPSFSKRIFKNGEYGWYDEFGIWNLDICQMLIAEAAWLILDEDDFDPDYQSEQEDMQEDMQEEVHMAVNSDFVPENSFSDDSTSHQDTMPSYEPPSYEPPSYEPPSYEPPSYEPPSYEPPSYEPPSRNSWSSDSSHSYDSGGSSYSSSDSSSSSDSGGGSFD